MLRNKKTHFGLKHGQSTIEYLLLFGIVIAVMVAFLREGGFFSIALNNTIAIASNHLELHSNMFFPDGRTNLLLQW